LVAGSLGQLLRAMAKLRAGEHRDDPARSDLIREGAQLAVRLAEILQRAGGQRHVP
jgi:hypothetical protein